MRVHEHVREAVPEGGRSSHGARHSTYSAVVRREENAERRLALMLIESTEQFQASSAIAIRRGRNEVAETDYERLPIATRTKLRILAEHGVLQLGPSTAETALGRDKQQR